MPALTEECVELAQKIAKRYAVPLALSLRLFLPSEMRTGKVRELYRRYAALAVSLGEITLPKTAKNQQSAVEYLAVNGKTDCALLNKQFPGSVTALEKKGYITVTTEQIKRDPYKTVEGEAPVRTLTAAQEKAVEYV